MRSKVASSSNGLVGFRGDVLEPSNPTTVEKQVTSKREETYNTFSSKKEDETRAFHNELIVALIQWLLGKAKFTKLKKDELGLLLELLVEYALTQLLGWRGFTYRILYRDFNQHKKPDLIVMVWYKHQLYFVGIECHNYHVHYPVVPSWAKKNGTDKFEHVGVKLDLKVIIGSPQYTKSSVELIQRHGLKFWELPDAVEDNEGFEEAEKMVMAYIINWLDRLDTNLDTKGLKTTCGLSTILGTSYSVNTRYALLPDYHHKVMYGWLEEVDDG